MNFAKFMEKMVYKNMVNELLKNLGHQNIIYLCTLEILPLLIVFNLLLNNLSRLFP